MSSKTCEDDGIRVPIYKISDGHYTYGDNKTEYTFDELVPHLLNITVYNNDKVRFYGLFKYPPEYVVFKKVD